MQRTWLFATNWECHSQNSLAFHVGNDIFDLFVVSFALDYLPPIENAILKILLPSTLEMTFSIYFLSPSSRSHLPRWSFVWGRCWWAYASPKTSSRKPSTVNHLAIQIQSILRLPSKHDAWHIPRHSNCIAGTSFFDTGKQQLGVKWPSLPLNTHQGFTFLLFKSCHTIDPNVTVFVWLRSSRLTLRLCRFKLR
jgi:hypothetical protein